MLTADQVRNTLDAAAKISSQKWAAAVGTVLVDQADTLVKLHGILVKIHEMISGMKEAQTQSRASTPQATEPVPTNVPVDQVAGMGEVPAEEEQTAPVELPPGTDIEKFMDQAIAAEKAEKEAKERAEAAAKAQAARGNGKQQQKPAGHTEQQTTPPAVTQTQASQVSKTTK